MKTYAITGPDGKEYSIDGPEGATREQVIAKIQERLSSQGQSTPQPEAQQTAAQTQSANISLAMRLLNSPVGGLLRGLRDIPDAGAELLTSGLNAIAPAGSKFEKFTQAELDKVRNINKAAEQDYRQNWRGNDAPSFDTGRIGGNILGTIFIPGANSYAGSALLGGGLGMLGASDQNKGEGAAIGALGGVAGNAIGRGISSLLSPVPRLADVGRQQGVNAADKIGAPLLPGERTGSTALRQVESVLERTPGSAGMFDRIKDLKQKAINTAAAKSIGENTDTLSEAVISNAQNRISQKFNDIYSKTNISLGKDFADKVNQVAANNQKLGPYANANVNALVDKSKQLLAMKNIPPDVYQLIRTELTMSADDAYRAGNSSLGGALKTIRNSLDDSARSSLPAADQAALDAVRKEYAHLKTLVKGNTIEAGNVKPHLVNNALAKFNSDLYKSGAVNSPLQDIGRYSQTFKSSAVPNSGTPERTAMYNMMFGNPVTGLPITALANLYGRAYLSNPMQNYLTKGIVNLSPEVQRLLALSGGATGAYIGSTANQ